MAAEDINFENSIEHKLVGIAKGVGIEFKSNYDRRGSTNFREQMKEKQRKNKEKRRGA